MNVIDQEDLPKFTRLSSSAEERQIPLDWRRDHTKPASDALDVHFLVLPTYIRYNNETPLAPTQGPNTALSKDLLFFPLGCAQVVSSLWQFSNHRIEVIDPYAHYVDLQYLSEWLEAEYTKRGLSAPDYMLIGGLSTSWPVIRATAKALKKTFPDTVLCCGGTVAGLHFELLIEKLGFDIAIIGEAEFVTAELFHNIDNLGAVRGIAFKNASGNVVKTPPPPPHDLNIAPEPAWDYFNTEEYIQSSHNFIGFRGLPINTSMGCPYACRFCYVPGGKQMRYLTPDNVVDRMRRMKNQFNLDYVAFYDDILFVDKKWMRELGEKLIDANLDLMWNCSSRVNLFTEKDKPLLKLLRRSGLIRIAFGIETGSPKILKNMGKTGVSPEKSRLALRLVRESGVRATANMILGYPGEDPETIKETIDFCKETLLHPSFYLLQPFPGTDVYEKHVREMYDEEAYLELISDYRDGETFPINLTKMSDEQLMSLQSYAEGEMKKFHPSHYVRYHGWKTPLKAVEDGVQEIHRRIRQAHFLTP